MVAEAYEAEVIQEITQPRDRWEEAFANQPVRRVVALFDYNPQVQSPNVNADDELGFQRGQIVHVYGEADADGFYLAEIDGVRGLVPNNFFINFIEHNNGHGGLRGVDPTTLVGVRRGRGAGVGPVGSPGTAPPGPGARSSPPPPRALTPHNQHRHEETCPLHPSQLDNNTRGSNPEQANSQAEASEAEAVQGIAQPRDLWTEAFANLPVRRMFALFNYNPQLQSRNVNTVNDELGFHSEQVVDVYGEVDADGFYMAEIDGVRGLVPHNFFIDTEDDYFDPWGIYASRQANDSGPTASAGPSSSPPPDPPTH